MAVRKDLVPALAPIINALANAEYDSLVRNGTAGSLSAAEIELAIKEYGRKLVNIPEDGWLLGHTYEITKDEWAVDLPLWTVEEGRSDLELSVHLKRLPDGNVLARLQDIHVL